LARFFLAGTLGFGSGFAFAIFFSYR